MSDSDIILKVENLSKTYFPRHQPQRSLKDLFTSPFQVQDAETDRVEALKDVSFELKRGESLGIIGPNGAGKSTLLKILSGVTTPTSGKATINGRVLSVLDIGTGFHPDLTGRQNVYLKGQLMGLRKMMIEQSIESIISFSEIGAFIDYPVKKYSNGMFLRLAFSSLIHLDADILILDEVLAYGDMAFRAKCVRKFTELAEAGRSIVLVSHSMSEVTSLCDTAILIQNGISTNQGNAIDVVDTYTRKANGPVSVVKKQTKEQTPAKEVVFRDVISNLSVHVTSKNYGYHVYSEYPFDVTIAFTKPTTEEDIEAVLVIKKAEGEPLISYCAGLDSDEEGQTKEKGNYCVVYTVPGWILNRGVFFISVFFAGKVNGIYNRFYNEKMFEVKSAEQEHYLLNAKQRPVLKPKITWKIERFDSSKPEVDTPNH